MPLDTVPLLSVLTIKWGFTSIQYYMLTVIFVGTVFSRIIIEGYKRMLLE